MQKKLANILINTTLLATSVFCTLLATEIAVRIYDKAVHSKKIFSLSQTEKELGWPIRRMFGDFNTDKFKLLVIGDSFTNGLSVPVGKQYHHILKDLLPIETFAMGGGGYGTYQEYLALKRHLPQIQPDAILLQVCKNDFINNSRTLEKKSYLNNNHRWRPYYENGQTVFVNTRAPLPFPSLWIQSRLFGKIDFLHRRALVRLAGAGYLHGIEEDIEEQGMELKEFKEAVSTTHTLIRMIKEEAEGIPILAFEVGHGGVSPKTFKKIFSDEAIPFLEEVGDTLYRKKSHNEPIVLQDGDHWNENGHRIVAETLAKLIPTYLEERYGVRIE